MAFVHGFYAEPAGWQPAADALARQFVIDPVRPDLEWTRRFEAQRATLEFKLGSGSSMPAAGHSNGGLVSRYYVGASGSSRVDRILTVNSGHHGAPLAGNILNYRAKAFAVSLVDAIVAPWSYQWLPIDRGDAIRKT
ncbi:MAG: hypothetical protein M3P24_11815, partial [Gemmatimonadota bacterium]|nr:hypothetical protein [Gemmatimonadota bacterium]